MTTYLFVGDCRNILLTLPTDSFDCIVTSPPYWGLRDYGINGQIGLEPTLDGYVETLAIIARELWRVLKPSGTFWLNIGDCYAHDGKHGGETGGKQAYLDDGNRKRVGRGKRVTNLKPKDLCLVPARVALRLQTDGWWLRSEIIWAKPNAMPESVTDRPTCAHEKVFLLSKSERYFYDADAIREAESVPDWDDGSRVFGGVNKAGANVAHGERTAGRRAGPRKRGLPPRHASYSSSDQSGLDAVGRGSGRNARNVWTIATQPYRGAHFATMPPNLAERCIRAGCPDGGHVLDPFAGTGTTGMVADRLGRHATLIDINPAYGELQRSRIQDDAPLLAQIVVLPEAAE